MLVEHYNNSTLINVEVVLGGSFEYIQQSYLIDALLVFDGNIHGQGEDYFYMRNLDVVAEGCLIVPFVRCEEIIAYAFRTEDVHGEGLVGVVLVEQVNWRCMWYLHSTASLEMSVVNVIANSKSYFGVKFPLTTYSP